MWHANLPTDYCPELLKTGRLSDLEIVSKEGVVHKIHSVILYLQSEYFRQLFSDNSKDDPLHKVELDDVSDCLLVRILEYLYGSKTRFTDMTVSSDIDDYKGIADDDVLAAKLSIDLYQFASRYGIGGLKQAARQFFNESWQLLGERWSSSLEFEAITPLESAPGTEAKAELVADPADQKNSADDAVGVSEGTGEASSVAGSVSSASSKSGYMEFKPYEHESYPEESVVIMRLVYDKLGPADRGLKDIVLLTLQSHIASGRYLKPNWACVRDLIDGSPQILRDLALRRFSGTRHECRRCYNDKQRHAQVPCNCKHADVNCIRRKCDEERVARSFCTSCCGIGCISPFKRWRKHHRRPVQLRAPRRYYYDSESGTEDSGSSASFCSFCSSYNCHFRSELNRRHSH